ncbi:MAG: hypothetical protein L0Z62_26775 [Gemmataceae bacterium]|nr:hypothetical protein [Gemmataceae bacterium]
MDTSSPLAAWTHRIPEIEALAGPLLHSFAFRRLEQITFLGILSPRFGRLVDSPLPPGVLSTDDGSRWTHSLGVTLLVLDLARRFGLSERAQRYAVAWGLTHDIATWPLSHTSEPAFGTLFGITSRQLRARMLSGSEDLPARYCLPETLHEMGVEPAELLRLFDRTAEVDDPELVILKQVVSSPLTPDTLEGIWRCGLVYGVEVPPPDRVQQALSCRNGNVFVSQQDWPVVVAFWERKAEIYRRFINREDVIRWESSWSVAILQAFPELSLPDSLELSEEEMVGTVLQRALPPFEEQLRFRPPQTYFVAPRFDDPASDQSIYELRKILRKEPVGR